MLLIAYVSVLAIGTYYVALESPLVGVLFCAAQIVFSAIYFAMARIIRSGPVSRIILALEKFVSVETYYRPTVTVIIPSHNCVHYLRDAVESALASVGVRVSVLIIDDQSTDGSRELANELADEDSRVRVVLTHKNLGAFFCRNIGLQIATSEFVAFLDSDDWQDKERLQRQISPILRNRKIQATYCLKRRWTEDLSLSLDMNPKLCHISGVFRKSLIEKVGYFDLVRFGADSEFRMRLISTFGAESIPTISGDHYRARVRPNSLTSSGAGAHFAIENGRVISVPNENRLVYRDSYEFWHSRERDKYVPFPSARRIFGVDLESHNTSPFLGEQVIGFISVNFRNKTSLNDSILSLLPQFDVLHVILSDNNSELDITTTEKIHFHVLNNGSPENGLKRVLSELSGYILMLDENLKYPSNYVARLLTEIEIHDRQAIVGAEAIIFPRGHENGEKVERPVVLRESISSTGEWVDLLGTGTIGFHSQTIQLTVADLINTSTENFVLAAHAASARIPQFSIHRPKGWIRKSSGTVKELLTRRKVLSMSDKVMSEFQPTHGDSPRRLFG